MNKQIFNEAFFAVGGADIVLQEDKTILSEAIHNATKRLVVKLPVGFVDKLNGNKRMYERMEVQKAIASQKESMRIGAIQGQHGKHPDTYFVDPDNVSHLIKDAWIDNKNVIWNEWLILNTTKGKDLAEMFLSGAQIGVSIRGRGVEHKLEEGKSVIRDYDYNGTDTVGMPSTGIYAGLPKVEVSAVNIEVVKEFTESLEETKPIMEDTTMQKELIEAKAANETLKKEKTEMATKIESLHKELDNVRTNFRQYEEQMRPILAEHKSFAEDVHTLQEQNTDMEERIAKQTKLIEQYKEYIETVESGIDGLRKYAIELEGIVEEFSSRAYLTDSAIELLRKDYKKEDVNWEEVVEAIRKRFEDAKVLADATKTEKAEVEAKLEAAVAIIEDMRTKLKQPLTYTEKNVHNYVGFLCRKHPKLVTMREELLAAPTINACSARAQKYLKFFGVHVTSESLKNIPQDVIITETKTIKKNHPFKY